MVLTFITGNAGKFKEVASVLGDVPLAQMDVHLPEIQDIDAEAVVREKLLAARAHADGDIIIEDTSVYLDCLGGKLPGPFIKWFREVLTIDGISELTERYENTGAEVRSVIGYMNADSDMQFFDGRLRGTIVRPRGDKGFAWDPIFVPDGMKMTFAEMESHEKDAISMRGQAARKLRDFLQSP